MRHECVGTNQARSAALLSRVGDVADRPYCRFPGATKRVEEAAFASLCVVSEDGGSDQPDNRQGAHIAGYALPDLGEPLREREQNAGY